MIPRFRDDLHIRQEGKGYVVTTDDGARIFELSPEGYWLVRRMDGIRAKAEVEREFAERFGKAPKDADLDSFVRKLEGEGCLVADGPQLRVLRELAERKVIFRKHFADRTNERADLISRRDGFTEKTFERGVLLINAGRLRRATAVFQSIADELPEANRVHTVLTVLRPHLDDPELAEIDDDAIEARLQQLVDQGNCPYCGHEIDIVLGGSTLCGGCDASFANPVVP